MWICVQTAETAVHVALFALLDSLAATASVCCRAHLDNETATVDASISTQTSTIADHATTAAAVAIPSARMADAK